MIENQATISRWATDTFGPVLAPHLRTAKRANEEMVELIGALELDDDNPKAIEEAADIVILLMVLASRMGQSLMAEVDRKMAINRAREWNVDPSGHGYHVRDKAVVNG